MKAKTVQIHWHQKHPVFSLDTHPLDPQLLVTAGGDNAVRTWHLPGPTYRATLNRHTTNVNVVRWHPLSVDCLASAGDDGMVLVWKRVTGDDPVPVVGSMGSSMGMDAAEEGEQLEQWSVQAVLLGSQMAPIYDLAWSPCGQYICTGSIMENVVTVWHVATRSTVCTLRDHSHFINGVAWDPLNQYLATQSTDRSVLIYSLPPSLHGSNGQPAKSTGSVQWTPTLLNRSYRIPDAPVAPTSASLKKDPVSDASSTENKDTTNESMTAVNTNTQENKENTVVSRPIPTTYSRLYHDETLVSFFRRLSFSPDGSLLVAPSGVIKGTDGVNLEKERSTNKDAGKDTKVDVQHAVYLYARNSFRSFPVAYFTLPKAAVVVRFNPVRYCLRPAFPPQSSLFSLPYRFLFAVGTREGVLIFDTQQSHPVCRLSNLHYAGITDLTWSMDGQMLLMSSSDGFCSMVCFEPNELGQVYTEPCSLTNQQEQKPDIMESSSHPMQIECP